MIEYYFEACHRCGANNPDDFVVCLSESRKKARRQRDGRNGQFLLWCNACKRAFSPIYTAETVQELVSKLQAAEKRYGIKSAWLAKYLATFEDIGRRGRAFTRHAGHRMEDDDNYRINL